MASKIDDLFAMKFMLPEHVAALAEHAYESTLVPRPVLEDDEMAEINRVICTSMNEDFAVTVRYWKETRRGYGEIRQMWGVVERVDTVRKQIKVANDAEFAWIDMRNITAVLA
ncbi:YolD-like family protein [Brevibacillus sp. NSP2.1]|uniref:YolD-like family protein n=1 Tax=Brevibacillus sp. NSP2.1 TaxID=3003229 RepID=UPI00041C4EB9|nr:YolD-like family protein [Brevibacillus sp. NSP2.1]QHZ58579.1 YolD-like family protein [Brevibacillus sp. NSP2.1]